MSEERIYVSYSIASAASANGYPLGYHKILNYIDKNGAHFSIEGASEIKYNVTISYQGRTRKCPDRSRRFEICNRAVVI